MAWTIPEDNSTKKLTLTLIDSVVSKIQNDRL